MSSDQEKKISLHWTEEEEHGLYHYSTDHNPLSINNESQMLLLLPSKKQKLTSIPLEEKKKFECALAIFDKDTPNRWVNVASMFPGKSVSQVIKRYHELFKDVNQSEVGRVPVQYQSSSFLGLEGVDGENNNYNNNGVCKERPTSIMSSHQEKKKTFHWTEEEKRRFLMGLQVHGKGNWKKISREYVVTKTPTQVASHAQKYYKKQAMQDENKRAGIHDFSVDNLMESLPSTSDQDKPISINNWSQMLLLPLEEQG